MQLDQPRFAQEIPDDVVHTDPAPRALSDVVSNARSSSQAHNPRAANGSSPPVVAHNLPLGLQRGE